MLKKIIKACLSKEQVRKVGNYRIKQKYNKNRKELNSLKARENYINEQFFKEYGYKIDFAKEPKTFSEKIQFRKLYTDSETNKLYAICADKYKVREYVANKIGEEYLIPLELVTDKLTIDDWNKLPNECVIKANHNSGPVQVIFDKTKENPESIIDEINFQLTIDYGVLSLESYYSLIERKVIVERLLKDKNGKVPPDYKFHMFKQKDRTFKSIIQVDLSRFENHTRGFFTESWLKLPYITSSNHKLIDFDYNPPNSLNKMNELAKKLAEDFDYVRVDFYDTGDFIYFGELTFAHGSGFEKFTSIEGENAFGKYWEVFNLKK